MDPSERHEPLVLRGSPRERGRQHGEALRERIGEVFAAWEQEIARETGLALAAYLERFAADTSFLSAIERCTPELLEEVRGLSEGAGRGFDELLALQCMDEQWGHVEGLVRAGAAGQAGHESGAPREKCSCLGVVGPPTLVAQNMDLPGYLAGLQTLLRIEADAADGGGALVLSFPGFLGLCGVADHGLALCVNTLSQLRRDPAGLPVAFFVRGVLGRRLDAARELLTTAPHASGQNYLLGVAGALVDLECSAGGAAPYPADLDPADLAPAVRAICHTNHPLASADLRLEKRGWDADRQAANEAHGLTFDRLESLQRAVDSNAAAPAGAGSTLTVSAIEALLSDPRGCVYRPLRDEPASLFTFATVVFELAPDAEGPRAHLRLQPAGPLVCYPLIPSPPQAP